MVRMLKMHSKMLSWIEGKDLVEMGVLLYTIPVTVWLPPYRTPWDSVSIYGKSLPVYVKSVNRPRHLPAVKCQNDPAIHYPKKPIWNLALIFSMHSFLVAKHERVLVAWVGCGSRVWSDFYAPSELMRQFTPATGLSRNVLGL